MDFVEETGKGGYHRVYTANLDEADFKRVLVESVFSNLLRDFPEETKIAFKEVFD